MYVNLYRAEPEPSMLELRGAVDLLRSAERNIRDADSLEEYHIHSRSRRADLYKAYQEANHIISMAGYKVSAQLRAMLGQNKRVHAS